MAKAWAVCRICPSSSSWVGSGSFPARQRSTSSFRLCQWVPLEREASIIFRISRRSPGVS